jgi:hypothetical protein
MTSQDQFQRQQRGQSDLATTIALAEFMIWWMVNTGQTALDISCARATMLASAHRQFKDLGAAPIRTTLTNVQDAWVLIL